MALVRVYCGLASARSSEAPAAAGTPLTAAVVDDAGRLLDVCGIGDDPAGYARLASLLAERSNGSTGVAIAADSDGHVVTALFTAAGRPMSFADEEAADDFAERFADDDSAEEIQSPPVERRAVGLARALQAGALSAVAMPTPRDLIGFKPVLAAHGALINGRQAAAVALREVLRELYPAALRAYPDPAEPVSLAILDALPEPGMLGATNARGREAGTAELIVNRLVDEGVSDATTLADAITALRVAVAETPRRSGANKSLTAAVAETVRQAVAAVRACDAACGTLVGSLTGRVSAPAQAPARRPTRRRAEAAVGAPPVAPTTAPPAAAPVAPQPQPSRVPTAPPRRARPQPAAAQAAPPVAPQPMGPPPVAPPPVTPRPTGPIAPAAAAPPIAPASAPPGMRVPTPPPLRRQAATPSRVNPVSAPPPVSPASAPPAARYDEQPGRPVSAPPPPPPGITPIVPAQRTTLPPADAGEPFRATLTAAAINSARAEFQQRAAEARRQAAEASVEGPPPLGVNATDVTIPVPVGRPEPEPAAPPGSRANWPLINSSDERAVSPAAPARPAAHAAPAPPATHAAPAAHASPAPPAAPAARGYAQYGDAPTVEPSRPPAGLPAKDAGRVTPPWQANDLPPEPPMLRLVEPPTPDRQGGRGLGLDSLADPLGPAPALDDRAEPPPLRLVEPAGDVRNGSRRLVDDIPAAPISPVTDEGDQDLLIFAEMKSAWFIGHNEDGPEKVSWATSADAGWRAAEQAAEPTVGDETRAGLPKRVPQANLVPGSPLREERPLRIVRDPASIAAHTTGYFRGWRRGQEIGGYAVGGRPGRESAGGWDFSRDPSGDDDDQEYEFRSAGYRS